MEETVSIRFRFLTRNNPAAEANVARQARVEGSGTAVTANVDALEVKVTPAVPPKAFVPVLKYLIIAPVDCDVVEFMAVKENTPRVTTLFGGAIKDDDTDGPPAKLPILPVTLFTTTGTVTGCSKPPGRFGIKMLAGFTLTN